MAEKKFGMVVDLSTCIGCNACAVACKQENEVPISKFNTWIESWDVQMNDGSVRRAQLPKLCNHCEDPACARVCPTKATHVTEEGVVLVEQDRCIGCKYCMEACPYGVRWVDEDDGGVRKCSFCYHRTSNGMQPACVSTCVTKSRLFGDLNDPESAVSKKLASAKAKGLLEEAGLGPKVYYIGLDETMSAQRVSAVHKGGNVLVAYGEEK
jgi:tetrathionate reductase subunit B